MDTYEWQKNYAIVNRLYYTERLWETTLFGCALYTGINMSFIKEGYFANTMRLRLIPIWGKVAAFNTLITLILLAPLTKEEMRIQTRKRFIMGKWLYSTFHLDPEQQKHGDFRLCWVNTLFLSIEWELSYKLTSSRSQNSLITFFNCGRPAKISPRLLRWWSLRNEIGGSLQVTKLLHFVS